MTEFYTVDMLQILRLRNNGLLRKVGNYQLGIIISAIIDLIFLERLILKEKTGTELIVITQENDITGNELLDEIYLTIRDCPKEYTLKEWIKRFLDSYNVYEKSHIESLLRREIFIEEPKIKQSSRYICLFSLIICLPFICAAYYYWDGLVRPMHYYLKNSKLQNKIIQELYDNLKSLMLPDTSMLGLIVVLKTTGLNDFFINPDYKDYVVKKYYQLQDYDFKNLSIKLLVKYMSENY